MLRALILTCACAPLVVFAADPWKAKKPSEWTPKETARVLTNSPWAKSASVEFDSSRMSMAGPGRMGGGPPTGDMGGPGGGMGPGGGGMGAPRGGGMGGPGGGGMGGPGGGGMEGPGGGMEAPKFVVRWESSDPVREAQARNEDPNAAKLSEFAKDYYVISSSSNRMPGGRRRGPGGEEGWQGADRPRPDITRVQEQLLKSTSLRVKGREPLAPGKVEVLQTATGMVTVFLFPRTNAIKPEDNEVFFETSMGPMVIKARFPLKDMVYDGRLSL